MKKKLLLTLMTFTLACSLVACSGKDDTTDTAPQDQAQQETVEDTTDDTVADDTVTDDTTTDDSTEAEATAGGTTALLADVWATYGENDKFYAMGGDMNHPVENAPGVYSLEDKEALAANLLVKGDAVSMIDEASSLLHGMLANNFTAGAFHLTDAANVDAFSQAMKESIATNQWMCGSPDQYVIYQVGEEYVVVVFGVADIITPFKEKFASVHGEAAKILVEENIAM